MPFIDIHIEFETTEEGNWTDYTVSSVELTDTDISREERNDLVEMLAQSDYAWDELPNSVMSAMNARLET